MSTGMILDGVFASQAIDSSGEILDIDGCDISTLAKDGVANYEHKEGDKKVEGGGNNGEEIVGRIIYAKKVFSVADCDTDREEKYWDQVKVPFIYGMVRLYDAAGHSGAAALAAQVRDHHANGEPLLVRYSIEGSTLERDKDQPNRLAVSVARRVAMTLKPCNRTAVSGLVADPKAPEGFEKAPESDKHILRIAGMEKTERLEHPLYTRLGGSAELESNPFIDDGTMAKLKLIAKTTMLKALEAGSYNAAPSALVGGAALQREDRGLKARAMAAVRDYGKKKFDKAEFRAFAKTYLPEADDHFLDHFTDLAHDYHMKKAEALGKKEAKVKQPAKVAAPKKTANPKPKKPKAPEPVEEPDNLLADAPAGGDTSFDFSSEPAAPGKVKKPKKLKPADIAPAQGDELKGALEEATNMSNGKFMGLSPIVRNGVELSGKELARYLGIPEPAPQQLTVRGKPVRPPQASKHIDITKCKHSIYEGHGKGCQAVEHGADEPHYNFDTGYLNVPARPGTFNMKKGKWNPGHSGGYFKHYIPGHYDPAMHGDDPVAGQAQADKEKADFNQLLEDPERSKYHDNAMSNWVLTHKLMRKGETPDEVVAYKTAFSMLSPNTPVPVHEMMMSYLVDSMKHTGIDIRDPKFAGARGHLLSEDLKARRDSHGKKQIDVNDPAQYGIYGDWKSRDTGDPNKLPQHAPEHSQRTLANITVKHNQKEDPKSGKAARNKGQLMSFMLAQNKFVNMAKYHKYHDDLVNVFRKHGPTELGDQEIVNQLMHHKEAAGRFEAASKRAAKSKKTHFEFDGQQYPVGTEYPHGVVVGGLAPKTSRLTVTMAGGGTMHVPDTHMNRFQFGLEKGRGGDEDDDEDEDTEDATGAPEGPKDNKAIAAIKKVLWEERNHHILNGMDRYYEKHSPAVGHMVDRWGHWLEGETPEQKRRHAVFGGFWKNWSAIVDHERSRGMWSNGKNDYSDHRPSWAATLPHTIDKFPVMPFLVMPKLKKGEEGYDESLPFRAAMLHHHWIEKYGEIPAAHLAMVHLIPQLMAAHAIRTVGSEMRKAEVLSIDVKKALGETRDVTPTEPGEQTVMFAGHPVVAGHALAAKGEYALLHEDNDHYVAVPSQNAQDWCHHDLVKLPKAQQGTHFVVTKRPTVHVSDLENK